MWWWLSGTFFFACGSVLVGFGMARPHRLAGSLGIATLGVGLTLMGVGMMLA